MAWYRNDKAVVAEALRRGERPDLATTMASGPLNELVALHGPIPTITPPGAGLLYFSYKAKYKKILAVILKNTCMAVSHEREKQRGEEIIFHPSPLRNLLLLPLSSAYASSYN